MAQCMRGPSRRHTHRERCDVRHVRRVMRRLPRLRMHVADCLKPSPRKASRASLERIATLAYVLQ
jgi:hypothetical protein